MPELTPCAPRTSARQVWMALVLALIAFAYFSLFRTYGLNLPDEGTLLHKYQRAANGERLYEDFHAGYTPGVYYLHSLLQSRFDGSIIPGRVSLAIANSVSTALLFALVAPLTGTAVAAIGALLFPAFMPIYPGHFASFNVPYPTWYSVTIFLAGLLASRTFLVRRTQRWALAAGALSALGFLFKPNVGAFQLACAMLLTLAAESRGGSGMTRLWWWMVWLATVTGVVAVFAGHWTLVELQVFVVPALAAAFVCASAAPTTGRDDGITRVAVSTSLVVIGFVAVTLPWITLYATRLPIDRLLEDVLFVGSDYARFFLVAHPQVVKQSVLLLGLLAVLLVTPRMLVRYSRRPLEITVAAVAVAAVCAVMVLSRRPMVMGLVSSIMSAIETVWAFAAAQAAIWALLVYALPTRAFTSGTSGDGNELRRASRLVLGVGATFLYLEIYPRTDYMHWVWGAPLAVAGGVVLLAEVARAWSVRHSSMVRSIVVLAFIGLPVAVGAIRVQRNFANLYRFENGTLARRPLVALANDRAPVQTNIGRARSFNDLERVAGALRQLTVPGENAFTFPALDVVLFLAARESPLRNSYFFPRFVSHVDEILAVWTMELNPPRFAVVLNENWPFFEEAPAYYFLLADFLSREYRSYLTIGRYAILAHESVKGDAPPDLLLASRSTDEPLGSYIRQRLRESDGALRDALADMRFDVIEGNHPDLLALLASSDEAVRAEVVHTLAQADDSMTAAALFESVLGTSNAARSRSLALRLAGEWAGAEAVPGMLANESHPDRDIASAARDGLASFAEKEFAARYARRLDDGATPMRLSFSGDERSKILSWLRDSSADPRLKTFAIAVSGDVGGYDEMVAAVRLDCTGPEMEKAAAFADGEVASLCASEVGEQARHHVPTDDAPGTADSSCSATAIVARLQRVTREFAPLPTLRAQLIAGAVDTALAPFLFAEALKLIESEDIFGPRVAADCARRNSAADRMLAGAICSDARSGERSNALWLAYRIGGQESLRSAIRMTDASNTDVRAAAMAFVVSRAPDRVDLLAARNDASEKIRSLAELANASRDSGTLR